jgi:hypothetical protein
LLESAGLLQIGSLPSYHIAIGMRQPRKKFELAYIHNLIFFYGGETNQLCGYSNLTRAARHPVFQASSVLLGIARAATKDIMDFAWTTGRNRPKSWRAVDTG